MAPKRESLGERSYRVFLESLPRPLQRLHPSWRDLPMHVRRAWSAAVSHACVIHVERVLA